jgi:hypothetical protein
MTILAKMMDGLKLSKVEKKSIIAKVVRFFKNNNFVEVHQYTESGNGRWYFTVQGVGILTKEAEKILRGFVTVKQVIYQKERDFTHIAF